MALQSFQVGGYCAIITYIARPLTKTKVGHPFDTIKVRLQTTEISHFRGPVDCLMQTLRNEGFAGLYKGATPPLVGWMFMDSVYDGRN